MNKEHFLTELKIHLKPLSNKQTAYILQIYSDKFDEQMKNGETEFAISKGMGNPKNIAFAILEEFGISSQEDVEHKHDDWRELSEEEKYSYEQHYENNYERPKSKPTFFVRFCQIVGIVFLNLFFMIWLLLTGLLLLFTGWLVTIILLLIPILGLIAFFASFGLLGMFQLSMSLVCAGIGIIGFLILWPLTKYALRFIKHYTIWTFSILRGHS